MSKEKELRQRLAAVLNDLKKNGGTDPEAVWTIGSLAATLADKAKAPNWPAIKNALTAEAYDKLLDSQIADMKNVGPRWGGSITAAQFLQRFVDEGTPWAHLDIAGMVWADKPGATWDKGATGFGVRLIDRYVRDTLER